MAEELIGVHSILEALRAGQRRLQRVHVAKGADSEAVREIVELARSQGVPVRRESRETLDRLAGGQRAHQGVVALAGEGAYSSFAEILEAENPFFVILDGVQDPHNLGAVIRTAEAAGATGLIVPERRTAPLSAVVARSSAGAIEHVPIVQVKNLVNTLRTLKHKRVWVVGVDPHGDTDWTDFDYTGPVALVLGGEGGGIRRLVRQHCDVCVRLPMHGRIDSLNVSVAAGIVLFEVVRQRGMGAA